MPSPCPPYFRQQIDSPSVQGGCTMTKRLGRAAMVAVVGVVFGLGGVVGESVAQSDMKKDDKMKSGDTMMKDEKKGEMKGEMKADETKKDGKGMMKDDKMMQGDKPMDKRK